MTSHRERDEEEKSRITRHWRMLMGRKPKKLRTVKAYDLANLPLYVKGDLKEQPSIYNFWYFSRLVEIGQRRTMDGRYRARKTIEYTTGEWLWI